MPALWFAMVPIEGTIIAAELGIRPLCIYIELCAFADSDGNEFPCHEGLGDLFYLTRRDVRRAITTRVTAGLIELSIVPARTAGRHRTPMSY